MLRGISFLSLVYFLSGCQTTHPIPYNAKWLENDVFAKSELEPKSGSKARGIASFAKVGDDIEILISVTNVTPGAHGIHLHEKGDCSASDASSAGDHFNPAHLTHGQPDPKVFHMGDLGNINVDKDGNGKLKLVIEAARFHPQFNDWSIIIGKSIVLHKKTDDLHSQPSGDSGDRIACGVISSIEGK